MKLIDRLYNKVQAQGERIIMAFVTIGKNGLYTADCRLWDGIKGSGGRSLVSTHGTEQEALEAVSCIAEQYPNKRNASIFIDDLDFEDESG